MNDGEISLEDALERAADRIATLERMLVDAKRMAESFKFLADVIIKLMEDQYGGETQRAWATEITKSTEGQRVNQCPDDC